MLQRWIIAMIAICLITGLAFSQGAKVGGEARQIAMGGSNAGSSVVVNPFLIDDPTFILVNPAYQARYGSYIWWNIGGGTTTGNTTPACDGYGQQNLGVSFNLSKDLIVGATFAYDPSAAAIARNLLSGGTVATATIPAFIPDVARGGGVTGPQTIPAIQNVYELLAALRTGAMDLGFGFTYGTSKNNHTLDVPAGGTSIDNTASSSMLGFRGGLIIDMGSGSLFDAHAALRLDKATDNVTLSPAATGQGSEYSASATEIDLGARMRMHVSNHFSFVPYGSAILISASPQEDKPLNAAAPIGYDEKVNITTIAFGAGGEYKSSNFLLAGGASFVMIKAKGEATTKAVGTTPSTTTTNTTTYTAIPSFNLGAEWWLTDWLAARGGFSRMLGNLSTKSETPAGATGTATDETIVSQPQSLLQLGGINSTSYEGLVTLGLGLRFGNYSLDATVSDGALRRGLGLLGTNDNMNTFGYMTMSYNFE